MDIDTVLADRAVKVLNRLGTQGGTYNGDPTIISVARIETIESSNRVTHGMVELAVLSVDIPDPKKGQSITRGNVDYLIDAKTNDDGFITYLRVRNV